MSRECDLLNLNSIAHELDEFYDNNRFPKAGADWRDIDGSPVTTGFSYSDAEVDRYVGGKPVSRI
jgi:hypothetical protein